MTDETNENVADFLKAQANKAKANGAKALVDAAQLRGAIDKEVARLGAMSLVDYELVREETAAMLGLRASVLDTLVIAWRKKGEKDEHAVELLTRVPCDQEVDGCELIADIIEQIGLYVYLPEHFKIAVALWIIAAHAFDAFYIFPR